MNELSSQTVRLTSINVSNTVICTDASNFRAYSDIIIENMNPGTYELVLTVSKYENHGSRIKELFVLGAGVTCDMLQNSSNKVFVDHCNVTSGLFAISDLNNYRKNGIQGKAYDEVMKILSGSPVDVVKTTIKGVAIASGFGGGSFPINGVMIEGKMVGLHITFIDEYEEEM